MPLPQATPAVRVCAYAPCSCTFTPARSRQRYCTRVHKERAHKARAQGYRPPCQWCGGEVDPTEYRSRRFCSAGCRWASKRLQSAQWRQVHEPHEPRPTDLRYAYISEYISGPMHRAYIAALRRDPCAYCGAPAEAIDHIVPASVGGDDHPDNYTGACGSCNSTKQGRALLTHALATRVVAELTPLIAELDSITGTRTRSTSDTRARTRVRRGGPRPSLARGRGGSS